jgi:hypothetical protein
LIIPIVMAIAAAAAFGLLHAMHWNPHAGDVITAAVVCMISGTAALAPAFSKRRGGITPLFQAGLMGTVLHLLVTLACAAVIMLGKLSADRRVFLYLILVFYWVSLVTLVRILARLFREEMNLTATAPQSKIG